MNRILLSEIIKKRGLTATQMAEALGISRATYFRKLALPDDKLTLKEIKQIGKFLKLDGSKMRDIFFDGMSQIRDDRKGRGNGLSIKNRELERK